MKKMLLPLFLSVCIFSVYAADMRFDPDSDGSDEMVVRGEGGVQIGNYVLPSHDGTDQQILKTDGDGNVSWADEAAGGETFWSQSNNNISFVGGNVGIGTDNPKHALHIVEEMDNETSASGIFIYRNAPEGNYKAGFRTDKCTNTIFTTTGRFVLDGQRENWCWKGFNLGWAWKLSGDQNYNFRHWGYITETEDHTYVQLHLSDETNNYELTRETTAIEGFDVKMPFSVTGGNAGIGVTAQNASKPLDVNGSIRTRPQSSDVCSADAAGTIMFDDDDRHFYGCNGIEWRQLDV